MKYRDNGYMLFAEEHIEYLKDEYPDMNDLEIMKEILELWKNLSEEEQDEWSNASRHLKQNEIVDEIVDEKSDPIIYEIYYRITKEIDYLQSTVNDLQNTIDNLQSTIDDFECKTEQYYLYLGIPGGDAGSIMTNHPKIMEKLKFKLLSDNNLPLDWKVWLQNSEDSRPIFNALQKYYDRMDSFLEMMGSWNYHITDIIDNPGYQKSTNLPIYIQFYEDPKNIVLQTTIPPVQALKQDRIKRLYENYKQRTFKSSHHNGTFTVYTVYKMTIEKK